MSVTFNLTAKCLPSHAIMASRSAKADRQQGPKSNDTPYVDPSMRIVSV